MTADETVDTPVTIDFNGKKYKVRQIGMREYGEIIRYLKTLYIGEIGKSMRIAGLKEDKVIAEIRRLQFEEWGIKGDTEEERKKLWKEKVAPLLSSDEAISHILYLALRKEHPDLTLEEAQDIVANNIGMLDKLIAYAMGTTVKKPKNVLEKKKKEKEKT